ncbi:MAG: glycosyltransferase family 39 protein [Chloroflexia bacterium]
MIATRETTTTRPALRVGRLEGEKLFSGLSLAGPLIVSALLNLWNLAQNGYSNLYYSVAVQSMVQSWHNFFFASYDAGGFITVDKPPVALWVQALSARIFGFSPLSLLLPEALAGVACVALTYYLVRRVFGTLAAFLAAMAMALTPIAVAMERTNNTDTILMFTLLLAALALTLAVEKARLPLLLLSMALVGVAFTVKMLAAFVVLPTFFLLYLVAAPTHWLKRLLHLALAGLVVFSVALSWPLTVDLTPPDQRPWVGGSQSNSVVELALGYNGLGRVTGNRQLGGRGGPGGLPQGGQRPNFGGNQPGGFPNFGGNTPPNFPNLGGNTQPFGGGGPGGPGGGPGNMFGAGNPGPLRLFTGEMAGQWSWLFPLAALGLLAAALTVRRWLPLDRRGQALLLWGGWLATYGVVFSMASGIFHPYYLTVLAPAIGALVGIGLSSLLIAYRQGGWRAWLLPAALFATALWQTNVLSAYPQWSLWLTPVLLLGGLIAAAALLFARLLTENSWRRWSPIMLGAALLALVIAPAAWSVTPVLAGPSNASLPVAGPEALNQNDPTSWTRLNDAGNSSLVSYLEDNQDGYLYLVAVSNSQQASSIALSTGKPVLATGGFMGSDPALTVDKLQEMVAGKQVRFILVGGGMGPGGRGMPGGANNSEVNTWVQSNCTVVDPTLYGGDSGSTSPIGGFTGSFGLGNNGQLYQCAFQ